MSNTSQTQDIFGPVQGHKHQKGNSFYALSFREADFNSLMDPLIMVDHFTMTEPTFGAHPHAGFSAVSVIFEDSEGYFVNRDSLGKHIRLEPGDAYWLVAAKGAVHDEAPEPGSKTHGLQIFVNLPAKMKHDAPHSRRIRAAEVPVIENENQKIRVVLGETNSIKGPQSPALPITLLDSRIKNNTYFTHNLPKNHNAWLLNAGGDLEVTFNSTTTGIAEGEAIALNNNGDNEADIKISTQQNNHFVLISASPLNETFVKKGPFVMSTEEDIRKVEEAYASGKLGQIAD